MVKSQLDERSSKQLGNNTTYKIEHEILEEEYIKLVKYNTDSNYE